jgi:formylglycine-generating enzyme required for sulfatase activity
MSSLFSISIMFLTLLFGGEKQNPPGTVQLETNKYIDQSEISNFAWKEYLLWLKQNYGENSTEFKNALPENDSWKELYRIDFSLVAITKQNMNYPVVGVSYKKAVDYCKWRTNRVNEKNKGKSAVEYRLPTEDEYIEAARSEKKDIEKFFNADLNLFSLPTKTKGFYTMFVSNNVSEMTTIEGKAFGGNGTNGNIALKAYTSPEKWLGFRCIAVRKD